MVGVHDVFNETLIANRRAENIVTVLNPTFTSVANGNWTAAPTWDYGANTKMHDSYIPNGRTVNLDVIAMPNSLRIDCTGAITGASATAYINGGIRKDFCATGAFTYSGRHGKRLFAGERNCYGVDDESFEFDG